MKLSEPARVTPVKAYGDEIKPQRPANIVCAFCVQNPCQAATTLQRLINQHGCEPPLKVDGSIGPATMAARNRVSHPGVYQIYHQARTHYESLKDKYPYFTKGWRNRIKRFPKVPGTRSDEDRGAADGRCTASGRSIRNATK